MPRIIKKQRSEMTPEEQLAMPEEGAQEGDWLDYMPVMGAEKGAVSMAKRVSKGALERIKSIAKTNAIKRGMEKLKTADESPFKQQEHSIDYSKLGQQSQQQVNDALRKDVPLAREIQYKRDPITGQQDMLAPPSVKKLSGDAIGALPPPPAAMTEMAPKGRIRFKRKEDDEDESALPPEEVSGAY